MKKRKPKPFSMGTSQTLAILTPDGELWSYTTFANEGDARAYIKWRCANMCWHEEEFQIVPATVTLRISHEP